MSSGQGGGRAGQQNQDVICEYARGYRYYGRQKRKQSGSDLELEQNDRGIQGDAETHTGGAGAEERLLVSIRRRPAIRVPACYHRDRGMKPHTAEP